jgi:hypothetical protein
MLKRVVVRTLERTVSLMQPQDDNELDFADELAYENDIFSSCTDLIIATFESNKSFAQYFREGLLNIYLELIFEEPESIMFSSALCTIAWYCTVALDTFFNSVSEEAVCKFLVQRIQGHLDDYSENLHNLCYFVSFTAEYAKKPLHEQFIKTIIPLLQNVTESTKKSANNPSEDSDNIHANSVSAIFQIAIRHTTGKQQSELLSYCIKNLPLCGDLTEARKIHKAIVKMWKEKDARIMNFAKELERVFDQSRMQTNLVDEETLNLLQ